MARHMRSPGPMLTMLLVCGIVSAGAGLKDVAAQETTRAAATQQGSTLKIRFDVEGTAITATLEGNETSRDFVSLLPLTLTLKDYAATEKISDLPRRLSTEGAPAGVKPAAGDLAYYAPWGNLAVFHRDFGFSSGLIKLGRLDAGLELMRRPGPLKARIERIDR